MGSEAVLKEIRGKLKEVKSKTGLDIDGLLKELDEEESLAEGRKQKEVYNGP